MKRFSLLFVAVATCAALVVALCADVPGWQVAACGVFAASALASPLQSAVLGMRNQILLPEFTGTFAANGRCALSVPLGVMFNDVTFDFTTAGTPMTIAQMGTMVASITQKLNSKPVREWTPARLGVLNGTYGAEFATANGYLRDYFAMPWVRTAEGEERNGLGTDGLSSFTYDIVWTAAAVSPYVRAWANVEEFNRPVTAFPFRHIRVYESQPVVNGTSQFPGGNLLKQAELWYGHIHFMSALVTSAELRVNRVTKWDNVPRALVAELMRNSRMALQANTYTMAFNVTSRQYVDILSSFGRVGDQLLPVADLRLAYTGTGAGTTDIVLEQFHKVELK